MTNTIYFYKIREKHGHMSNFFPCNINIDKFGLFKTSEHLYQSLKYYNHNMEYFRVIQDSKTAWIAAKLGRVKEPAMRRDWDTVKIDAMRFTVMHKYLQNKDLAKLLMATGNDVLVEFAPHRDYFWGWYENKGQNWLGTVLMEVREVLNICNSEGKNDCANEYLQEAIKVVGL